MENTKEMQILKEKAKGLGVALSNMLDALECHEKNTRYGDGPFLEWPDFPYLVFTNDIDTTYKQFAIAVINILQVETDYNVRESILVMIFTYMPQRICDPSADWMSPVFSDVDTQENYAELLRVYDKAVNWWDIIDVIQDLQQPWIVKSQNNLVEWNIADSKSEIQSNEVQILKNKSKQLGVLIYSANKQLEEFDCNNIPFCTPFKPDSQLIQNITKELTPIYQQFIIALYDVIINIKDWNEQNIKYGIVDVYMPHQLDCERYQIDVRKIADVGVRVDYLELLYVVNKVTQWRSSDPYKLNGFCRRYRNDVEKWRSLIIDDIIQDTPIREVVYKELPEPEDINSKAISNSAVYWLIKAVRTNQSAERIAETEIVKHLKIALSNNSKSKRFYDDRNKFTDLGKRNLKVFLQELIDKL